MDMIKKNVGNAEFTFVLNSRSNRSGFVHECELFCGYKKISSSKAQYYNRTWEAYRYQTVMLNAVYHAIDDARADIIDEQKRLNGWNKLTNNRRAYIKKIMDDNDGIKVLRELYEQVKNAHYGTEDERERLEALDCMLAVLELLKMA